MSTPVSKKDMFWIRKLLEAASILIILLLCQPTLLLAQPCYPIEECPANTTDSINKYIYSIPESQWENDGRSGVCPNSDDSNVVLWEVGFTRNSMTIMEQFCSVGVSFSSSVICTKEGFLVFPQVSNVFNQSGSYITQFSETNGSFNVQLPVRYNPIGVYALNDTVLYTPGSNPPVSMTWLIYLTTDNPGIRIYFQGQMIANEITAIDTSKYSPAYETSVCFKTTTGGKTIVYTLFVLNPTIESAGMYEAVVEGLYSDTITLVSNVSDFTPEPSSSPVVSISPSESITSEMTSFTSPTPSNTPTSSTNDSISMGTILAISIVGAVAIVTIIGVLIVGLICVGIRRRRKPNKQLDGEEVDSIPLGVNLTYRQRQLSVSAAPPVEQQPEQPTLSPLDHVDPPTSTDTAAHSSGIESPNTLSNIGEQHEQQHTATGLSNNNTTTTPGPGAAVLVEALRENTTAINNLISSQTAQEQYTRQIAENTSRSVEIQSEHVEVTRQTNEILEQNMVQGVDEPNCPNQQDLVYNPPTNSTSVHNIETTETSTSLIASKSHTHSIPSESHIAHPVSSENHINPASSDDHTHSMPSGNPTHPTSSQSQSPAHPTPSPSTESPTSDNQITRAQDYKADDIVERGLEPAGNGVSPTPNGATSNEPTFNGISTPRRRSVPVKTQEQLRKINIKIMDVHPEWKELARALHVDEGIIEGIARSQNQHRHDDRSRLQDVLVKWKRKGGERTWRIVHTALNKMKRNDIATKVADEIDNLDSNVPFDDDGYCDIMAEHLGGVESDWYTLALHLDLEYNDLEEIEGAHKTDVCLSRMLQRWRAIKGDATNITDIEDGLERIGNKEMADILREDKELHQCEDEDD